MVTPLKEQAFISLVIYAYNNEKIIANSLDKLWNILYNKFEYFEIIVVNDASIDNTEKEIKDYANTKNLNKITLINLTRKHSLETAMLIGVDFAIGDFVIELDSPELHYNEDIIYKLYEKSCEGYDIVSLTIKSNNMFSNVFYSMFNIFSHVKIDINSQIAHILTRRALNSLLTFKSQIRYRKFLHVMIGYNKTSIYTTVSKKIQTSYTFNNKVKTAIEYLFAFTSLGTYIGIFITLSFLLLSVIIGIYALYQYIIYNNIVAGWTPIMLFLSLGFSGLFAVFTIVIQYLVIIMKEVRTLPKSIIKNIEKL